MQTTTTNQPNMSHLLRATVVALLLGSIPSILFSCGPKDDGAHRSENGVLLEPGERFEGGERRK
jgi:hypothetical protein